MLPVRAGTRYALPVTCRSGQMNFSAFTAPDDGMMFSVAAQESRRSFMGLIGQRLGVGEGVYGREEPVPDPHRVPQHLDHRRQGVGVVQFAMLTMRCLAGS
jgi:hypothetical protein